MALCLLNGVDVLEASICMPARGTWHVDLVVDAGKSSGLLGRVSLLSGGSFALVGSAVQVGAAFGTTFLRMVGGGGGLAELLTAQQYQQVTLQVPLLAVLKTGGEALDPHSDPSILGLQLPMWMQGTESLSSALDSLVGDTLEAQGVPAATWRVLPNGNVWAGRDSWPAQSVPYQVMAYEAHVGRLVLGVDSPALLPGSSFLGQAVVYVEHQIKKDSIRTLAELRPIPLAA